MTHALSPESNHSEQREALSRLKRYEPEPVIEERNGRLKVTGAAMMEKADGRWVRLTDALAQPAGASAQQAAKPCTCHPDDSPPVPCAKRYALSECRIASTAQQAEQASDAQDAGEKR